MALEPEFFAMTNQTVTIEPLSTHNAYGAPSFGSASSAIPTYHEPGVRVVVNQQGVEEIASAMLYILSTTATCGPQDRITLADGRKPKIVRVDILNDEQGQHHLEVAL